MTSRTVFMDSSFWICLRDEQEPQHQRAQLLANDLLRERSLLAVTPLILAETHAYFTRALRRKQQILDDVENNPVIRCEQMLPSDQQEAIQLLRRHRDKTYSFCDCLSFVVMKRLGISRVATFDHHFHQFGEFEVIN